MRFIEFLILFFGLLGMSCKATYQTSNTISPEEYWRRCIWIFGVPACPLPFLVQTTPTPAPSCRCVPSYQCTQKSSTMITDDSQGQDQNNMPTELCPGLLDICCPNSSIINNTDNETTSTTPTLAVPKNMSQEAEFGEFPWMVAVIHKSYTLFYECGGSLIHPRAVLTAAHTTQKYVGRPGDLLVRAGEWDTRLKIEPLVHQDRDVETVIIHDNFNPGDLRNDFAVLILRTDFEIAPHINTIHLPQPLEVFEAIRCVASGWGKNEYGSQGSFQRVLKKVDLPVVPRDFCQKSLSLTDLGHDFVLHPSFICAGGEPDKAMCTGDGGSPLVCPMQNNQSEYVQVGIVSWGIGCGQYRVPGVYASVSNARQWIDSKLALFNLDAKQENNFIPLSPENIF